MSDVRRYRNDLLIEIIARRLGFERLSEWLPGPDIYPPYLFVAVGLFVEYGFFDTYNYFVTGKSSFISQPNSLAIPLMTLLAVVGVRYLHDEYADAVVSLHIDDGHVDESHRKRFEGLLSLRARLMAYGGALVANYAFVFGVLGIGELVSISGVGLVLYGQLVSFPLIVIPTLVELAISYVAVHLIVPRRLARADVDLFFYDPRNLGGFEPIGQLLKRSYYIYTGVLLLWFLQTHAPVLLAGVIDSPYPAPGPIYQVAISAIWFVGVLSIGYSMYRVHTLMESKREERMAELEREIRTAVDDPYRVHPDNVDDWDRYEEVQETIAHVRNTSTYPTTFAMWSQIFVSVLLPQVLNMAVSLPG
ncbi:hypothetical protein [Halolamina rubra]|uniref:hypothetical protein n=1 Tax=Halolamina rubra TaxID=1380430 RepID=UPI000678F117|nr:hypothetical protein [Halolamina rubra]